MGLRRQEIGWMMDEQVDEYTTTIKYIYRGNEQCYHLKNKLEQLQGLWENQGEDKDFIENYNLVLQQYMDHHGYEWEVMIQRVAKSMEMEEEWWNLPFLDLSGGQKTRVKLARLLINEPQLLVLDEPTNHMDALERLESKRIEKPKENKGIEAFFEGDAFEAKRMVEMKNVSFSHNPAVPFFQNLQIQIHRGDRVAVVGKNGSGKTTLLKLLTGTISPAEGEVHRNPQLKIGYFMQELDHLTMENSILDELLELEHLTQEEARTILACFLFRREDVFKKMKDLSMGEKCRVAFAKLYFSDANLLVLDEPTNYLDISTREQIEATLAVYHGSVVIVSHDPYLLRKVANRVIEIEYGQIFDYKGSYSEWEEYQKPTSERQKRMNEIALLELELVELYNQEAVKIEKIKDVKKRLEKLKDSITE